MEVNNVDPKIITKLQALIRLQEKATTPAELENATSKIRAMLLKYNLDMEDIRTQDPTKREEVDKTEFDPETLTQRHEGKWVSKLAGVIARHNMCAMVFRGGTDKIYIVGTKSNVQITWFLVEQLVNRIRPMSREQFRLYEGNEKRNTFFRGFFLGAVDGIQYKLAEDAQREVYHAKQAHASRAQHIELDETQSTALALTTMLVKETKRVEEFMFQKMNIRGSKSVGKSKSQSGRQLGFEVGKGMSINKGIS